MTAATRVYGLTALVLGAGLLLGGCTAAPIRDARNAFYTRAPSAAADALSEAEEVTGRDRLLWLMEKGAILHHAGRYEESADALLAAARLMDQQDIVNVGQQTASLATNDWATEYKGEYSERLWVHTYLMMNFLMGYRYDSALVEAKKALKLFKDYPDPLQRAYFTRALIALCYENLRLYNDAYIEYKALAETLPDPAAAAPDLFRMARRLGFADEAERYRAMIPAPDLLPSPNAAEVVVFAATGKGPVKVSGDIVVPPSIRFSFPRYLRRSSSEASVSISGVNGPTAGILFTTDVTSIAEASLSARAARLAFKETARAALKESVARAIERKNDEFASILARAVLFIMEEPDTRTWETLPAGLTLARFRLAPGVHRDLTIRVAGELGEASIAIPELELRAGQRVYYSIRTTP